ASPPPQFPVAFLYSTSKFRPSGPRPFRLPCSIPTLALPDTCASRLFSGRAFDVRMQDANALCIQGQEGWGAEQLILLFLFVLTGVLLAPTTDGTAPRPRAPPDPAPGVDSADGTWQGHRGAPNELKSMARARAARDCGGGGGRAGRDGKNNRAHVRAAKGGSGRIESRSLTRSEKLG
ncbi:mCG1030686, partial [Mus musculus]